jgi:hypothetical protein
MYRVLTEWELLFNYFLSHGLPGIGSGDLTFPYWLIKIAQLWSVLENSCDKKQG